MSELRFVLKDVSENQIKGVVSSGWDPTYIILPLVKGNVLSYGLTSKAMVTILTNHHMYMRLPINLKMSSYIFICIKVFYNFDRYYTDSKNSLIKINHAKYFKSKPEHFFIVVWDGSCYKAQAGLRCSDLPSLPPCAEMKTLVRTATIAPRTPS